MDKAGVEGCVRMYNDGGRDMLHRGSMVSKRCTGALSGRQSGVGRGLCLPEEWAEPAAIRAGSVRMSSMGQRADGGDPTQSQQSAAAPPPQRGGAVRGAAGGAAVGAVGGAIAGDAGKGAAVGAGVGGTTGAVRQGRQNRQTAQAQQQAQAQAQAGRSAYDQAYAACMQGRGYQVS